MADSENLISAELNDGTLATILGHVEAIRALMPFLIALDSPGRAGLLKPGDLLVDALDTVVQLAEAHPALFPAEITDLAEQRRDLNLARKLKKVQSALAPLLAAIDDSLLAAHSDFARGAYETYRHSKNVAKKIPGYDTHLESLRRVLDRKSQSKPSGSD